jgi:hypothetical protein
MDIGGATKSFLTLSSLVTFGGASLAVLAVSNTWYKLFGSRPALVGFITCLLITFGGAFEVGQLKGPIDGGIAFLNACLLFSSAAGFQEGVVAPRPQGLAKQQGAERNWRASWFR